MPSNIDVAQFGIVGVADVAPANVDIAQFGIAAVSDPPPLAIDIAQMGIIAVLSGPGDYRQLDNVIPLNCWQPCTAYGYYGINVIFG